MNIADDVAKTRAGIAVAAHRGTPESLALAKQLHQRAMLLREVRRRGPLMRAGDRVELARVLVEGGESVG